MTGIARATQFQLVHYLRKTVNWNDAGIAGGVVMGTLPKGALIITQRTDVPTAFNAGTTNALNVGITATGTEIFTDAATAGARQPTIAAVRFAADTDLFVSYAQTGTAATAGKGTVVIGFVLDNDL